MKEPWRIANWNTDTRKLRVQYRADRKVTGWRRIPDDLDASKFVRYWIECSDDCCERGVDWYDDSERFAFGGIAPTRWRPASTMPKWAERRGKKP